MRLYRPVGLRELTLIFDAEMAEFPPRLPEQPIFYPVLNAPYAIQIARNWNTKNAMKAGYVTAFDIEDAYAHRFAPHIVGSRQHEELWVPAEELAEFNRHIVGKIRVVEAYFGDGFTGYVPERFGLKGKNAIQQFIATEATARDDSFDLTLELSANRLAVFLHFPFWARHDFSEHGIPDERRDQALRFVASVWRSRLPEIHLCYAQIA
jgi:hypothetical protein